MTRVPVLVTYLLLLPRIRQAKVFLFENVSETENTDKSTEGQDYNWIHDIQDRMHDRVYSAVGPIPLFDTLAKPLIEGSEVTAFMYPNVLKYIFFLKRRRSPVQNSPVKLVFCYQDLWTDSS